MTQPQYPPPWQPTGQHPNPYGQQWPPPPPGWGPPPPPAPKPPRFGLAARIGMLVGGFILLGLIVKACGDDRPSATSASPAARSTSVPYTPQAATPAAPAAPVAPAKPAGPATTVSDGTYQVGVDIAAGRYKTPGPPNPNSVLPHCSYSRMKDDSGEYSAAIASDISYGPSSVTVKAGEFVQFGGSCTWTRQS